MAGLAPLRAASQHQQRFVRLCYRFQEERLANVRLLADFLSVCGRYHLPAPHIELPALPLYSFMRTCGILRMVPLRGIAGGTDVAHLQISMETLPEGAVLHVEGELDLSTAPALSNAIAQAYQTSPRVMVDLSHLDYIDIAGVHILERTAARRHRRFVVVGSKPTIRRVLELLDLIEVLPVTSSIDAARQYLRLALGTGHMI